MRAQNKYDLELKLALKTSQALKLRSKYDFFNKNVSLWCVLCAPSKVAIKDQQILVRLWWSFRTLLFLVDFENALLAFNCFIGSSLLLDGTKVRAFWCLAYEFAKIHSRLNKPILFTFWSLAWVSNNKKGTRAKFKQDTAVSVGTKPIWAPVVPIEVPYELTEVEITWIKSTLSKPVHQYICAG